MPDRSRQPGPLVWSLPEPPRSGGPSLSRAQIVRVALDLADTEGLAATTMRRIATELGSSTPMSLYRYVGSKDGLTDLMLDAVQEEIELPETPSSDWRADLRLLGRGMWAAARRHPWYAALSHTRPMFGPNALRCLEFGMAALDGLGLSTETMMTYVSMVNGHVIGSALQRGEEQKMRARVGIDNDEQLRVAAEPLHEQIIATGRYPTVSRWLADGAHLTGDQDGDGFEQSLEILLDGIAARIETPRRRRGKGHDVDPRQR